MKKKNTTPGPDGIPGQALTLVLPELSHRVRRLYDKCFQTEFIRIKWKMAKLILIQKPGRRSTESPSSYRPICFLDEISKVLEGIVAHRINFYLSQSGLNVADNQFSFRVEHSTINAIDSIINQAQSAIPQSGVSLSECKSFAIPTTLL